MFLSLRVGDFFFWFVPKKIFLKNCSVSAIQKQCGKNTKRQQLSNSNRPALGSSQKHLAFYNKNFPKEIVDNNLTFFLAFYPWGLSPKTYGS